MLGGLKERPNNSEHLSYRSRRTGNMPSDTNGASVHHQVEIFVRAITPALAQGLNLPTDDGILIEDCPQSVVGSAAGLKIADIITKVNGKLIQDVRQFVSNMYSYDVGDKAQIAVLRGKETLSFDPRWSCKSKELEDCSS